MKLSSILAEEGLMTASSERTASYEDLTKTSNELGKVRSVKYSPGSGNLLAIVEIDGLPWTIKGNMTPVGELTYEGSIKVNGRVYISDQWHEATASSWRENFKVRR